MRGLSKKGKKLLVVGAAALGAFLLARKSQAAQASPSSTPTAGADLATAKGVQVGINVMVLYGVLDLTEPTAAAQVGLTGVYDDDTRSAVRDFQAWAGMPTTGCFGPGERKEMADWLEKYASASVNVGNASSGVTLC